VIEQDVELASAVAGDRSYAADAFAARRSRGRKLVRGWLASSIRSGSGGAMALITPGAGWGAKRWPPERYAAVAERPERRGMQVLVNAPPEKNRWPRPSRLAARSRHATLPQLIALTRRIALCIGGDTGPLHLASALGRPVVGIYGPTDPSRNGPYGTRARVLRSPDSRRDHSRRDAPDPGLLTISPEDVLRAADELLGEESAR
jgi:heptosyltransferase I